MARNLDMIETQRDLVNGSLDIYLSSVANRTNQVMKVLTVVGTVDEIYYSPRMPYTLGLLGSLPRLDAYEGEPLTPIKGAPPSLINLPPGCPFSPRCPLARPHCDEEEPVLRPVEGVGHVAACHYAEELSGDVRAEEIFEVAIADAEIPAAGEEPA